MTISRLLLVERRHGWSSITRCGTFCPSGQDFPNYCYLNVKNWPTQT